MTSFLSIGSSPHSIDVYSFVSMWAKRIERCRMVWVRKHVGLFLPFPTSPLSAFSFFRIGAGKYLNDMRRRKRMSLKLEWMMIFVPVWDFYVDMCYCSLLLMSVIRVDYQRLFGGFGTWKRTLHTLNLDVSSSSRNGRYWTYLSIAFFFFFKKEWAGFHFSVLAIDDRFIVDIPSSPFVSFSRNPYIIE